MIDTSATHADLVQGITDTPPDTKWQHSGCVFLLFLNVSFWTMQPINRLKNCCECCSFFFIPFLSWGPVVLLHWEAAFMLAFDRNHENEIFFKPCMVITFLNFLHFCSSVDDLCPISILQGSEQFWWLLTSFTITGVSDRTFSLGLEFFKFGFNLCTVVTHSNKIMRIMHFVTRMCW